MRNGNVDGTLVAENGWRQGSILAPSLVTALIADHQIPAAMVGRWESKTGWLGSFITALKQAKVRNRNATLLSPTSDCWMVISQDCDLVQTDWSKEPYVELIRIRLAKDDEHSPRWLTSPRDLQFSDPPDPKTQRFVCSVHDRVQIDRKYLTDCKPDPSRTFDRENVRRVCLWIARRYVRAAFPDAFNERAKPTLDSLKKRAAIFTSRATCQLKSEQDMTLDHLRTWKRWDFDVLSLGPKRTNDPLPAVENLPPDQ